MYPLSFVKSSYSSAELECIEVAVNVPGLVAVRDSKDVHGPILHFGVAAWESFRSAVTSGSLQGGQARG
ncbi:DUF397 domain-containing protein [Streptomyces sp. NPDC003077]|uniref:DUF397 domain-containing protein n=1 Tax=Streptomyces sp. NPDC003077 TaxID=3154443 RepID=UPI0033AB44DE